MTPTIQGTPIRTALSASSSPTTGTIASYTPKAGDIIASWIRAGTTAQTITAPAGWVNPLGGSTVVYTSSHTLACVYHPVTAAEQIAGTAAWTLTSLFSSAQTGATYTCAVRGVDLLGVIDSLGTASADVAVTPHVLAGLTELLNNSLVLSGIGGDSTQTYATAPAGWTIRASNVAGQNTGALLSLNAATALGTDLAATNITPSSASKYASITLAFAEIKAKPRNYNRSMMDRVSR